jgi:hypothetical protein
MLAQFSAEFFARSPLLALPTIALGIFFCVFVSVSVRALWARDEHMQRLAALPLSDSEETRHG